MRRSREPHSLVNNPSLRRGDRLGDGGVAVVNFVERGEVMRTSFDKAFELTVGLEGKPCYDEGGFTIYGLAAHYNPDVAPDLSLEDAKKIYLERYWIPAGCDSAPCPLDICLFDSQVNPQNDPKLPGGGNQEIMNQGPESWQDYNLLRMIRYMHNSKPKYVLGHIQRVLRLSETIRGMK